MQLVHTDLLTALRASARDVIVLYEIYASDYDISAGFNPLDALERFAGHTHSFTHLAQTVSYRREILDDLKVSKNIGKQLNSVSIKVSNVKNDDGERYMSGFVLATDVQGLKLVVRAISRSIADPILESPNPKSIILFVGPMERPDGFTRGVGTLSAKPALGNIEAQVPPRDFESICPLAPIFKGPECLGTETLAEKSLAYRNARTCNGTEAQCIQYDNTEFRQGVNIVQIESSFVYKEHLGLFKKLLNLGTFGLGGRLLGGRRSTTVGNSTFNATPFGNPIPLILGRWFKQLIPLQYKDTGETIWGKLAAGRGPIADFVNVRSTSPNFSQPLEIVKHLGEYGGEGTQTADTVFPGGNFLSRLAYLTLRVIGSDVEVEDPVPEISAVVAGITVRMYSDVQPSGTGKLLTGAGGVTLPGSATAAPGTPAADFDTAINSRSPVNYVKLEDSIGPVLTSETGLHGTYDALASLHEAGPIETDASSFGVGGRVGKILAPAASTMDLTGRNQTIIGFGVAGSLKTLWCRNGMAGLLKSNYVIFRDPGRVEAMITIAGVSYSLTGFGTVTGQYHMITLVLIGTRMEIYIDECLANYRDDLPAAGDLDFSAWAGYTTRAYWTIGYSGPAGANGEIWTATRTSHVGWFDASWTKEDVADVWASAVNDPTGCPGNDWTDNPVDHARYLLTDPAILNNPEGYIDDQLSAYAAAYNCGSVRDDTNAERCLIPSTELANAGTLFKRYNSTGLLGPRNFESTRAQVPAGIFDREAEYESFDPDDPPTELDAVTQYRKRYTANLELRTKGKALDVLYDVIAPTGRLFFKWNPRGQIVIDSERPADHTYLRAVAVPTDTTIQVQDVLPWKNTLGSPYLLEGKILIGVDCANSEVRSVTAAAYSSAGNSIALASVGSGGPTATASGANLAGGSSSVQASGTVTITGTLANGSSITVTIDGIACVLDLVAGEDSSTIGLRMAAVINADPVLQKYVEAQASDNVVTIYAKVGVLTLSSALAENHWTELADPTTAPTLGSSAGALAAGIYLAAYAYRNANGSTVISEIASITITASKKIDVTSLGVLPAGVTSVDWYVSRSANSTDLGFIANNSGAAFSITSLPTSSAVSAPTVNTTGEECLRVMMSFASSALTYADTTRSNILKDTFTWPESGSRSEINQIKLKHTEAILDFAERPLTVNDTPHQEKLRKTNVQDVDLTAVDNYNQAARLGNGMLNTLRDGDFFFSWGAIGEALLLDEGDVVCVSHDSGGTAGFRNKPVRLKTLQINKVPEITLGGRYYRTIHYGDLIATLSEGEGGTGSRAGLVIPSTNPNFNSPPDIAFNETDFPPDGLVQATEGTAGITSIRGGAIFGSSSFGQYAKVRLIKRAGLTVNELIRSDLKPVDPPDDWTATFEFTASAEGIYTVELEVCNNRGQCNATKPTASIVVTFGSLFGIATEGGTVITSEAATLIEREH